MLASILKEDTNIFLLKGTLCNILDYTAKQSRFFPVLFHHLDSIFAVGKERLDEDLTYIYLIFV